MSNQHTIVLPHGRVLLQEVPGTTRKADKMLDTLRVEFKDTDGSVWDYAWGKFPDHDVIGITPLTEEQAGKVCKFYLDVQLWQNYLHPKAFTGNPIDSFSSLLTANNIDQSKRWVVLFTQE